MVVAPRVGRAAVIRHGRPPGVADPLLCTWHCCRAVVPPGAWLCPQHVQAQAVVDRFKPRPALRLVPPPPPTDPELPVEAEPVEDGAP